MIQPNEADEFALGELVKQIGELLHSVKATSAMLSPSARDQFQPQLQKLQEECAELANTIWEDMLGDELKQHPRRRASDRKGDRR